MQGHLFLIRTLTNLHMGSGDTDFGVVDKQVQRDATTGFPTIYASSLKGALRQHFEVVENHKPNSDFIRHVFGSPVRDVKEENGDEDQKEENNNDQKKAKNKKKQGEYRFLSADLLAIPQPSEDDDPNDSLAFRRAVSPIVLKQFAEKAGKLNVCANMITKVNELDKNDTQVDFVILDFFGWADDEGIQSSHQTFDDLAKELPVLARNHLDNGESQNLWYEEFVPHESLFGLIVLASDHQGYFDTFKKALDGKVVQLGANTTVGYGLCLFTHISNPA